jgi:hypothetical protein
LIGTPFFTHINGTINNVTNIENRIQKNAYCTLNASALFLGQGRLSTTWTLPLSKGNNNFTIAGTLQQMNVTALNQIIEPLALASAKKGEINKLNFNLTGDDYKCGGNVVFLYHDLSVEILKKGEGKELKSRELISFFANTLVKNNNPGNNGEIYTAHADHQRELNKSFFNLVWKSIFDGVKKTALGK